MLCVKIFEKGDFFLETYNKITNNMGDMKLMLKKKAREPILRTTSFMIDSIWHPSRVCLKFNSDVAWRSDGFKASIVLVYMNHLAQ